MVKNLINFALLGIVLVGMLGTLTSTMLPSSIIFTLVWTVLLLLRVALGIPLGPDGHLVYPPIN
jgi:p-aminobenzoyl-glutamate transporter AbgT